MPAVIALSAALTLGACSGDDDSGDDPQSESNPATASESQGTVPLDQCKVEVKVAGLPSASWKGKGYTMAAGETIAYKAGKGKNWILVTPAAGDSPATVVPTIGDSTFETVPTSVEVEESEDGVTAKGMVLLPKDKKASLSATFTCGAA